MRFTIFIIILSASFFSGCGYRWQSSENPWAQRGIKKVFVKEFLNNTMLAGANVTFTSAIVRELAKGKRITVVSSESQADALIQGVVDSAYSSVGPTSPVSVISKNPDAVAITDFEVASEYYANASVSVSLVSKNTHDVLWTQQFSGQKLYQANNRFGRDGATSALINASNEEFALRELAQNLANDAYGALCEGF